MRNDLFDSRLTEKRNPSTVSIDVATPLEIVDLINDEDRTVAEAVRAERESIARAIELAEAAFRHGGRLIYVGAGTSGRLGVLDAAECPPTFGSDPDMVEGVIAGGYLTLIRSQEGSEDDSEGAQAAIDDRRVGAHDFVLGIAASSTTPFVRAALARAAERGARIGLLCCTEPEPDLAESVDVCIVPLVGPEVIAGSTRMKAGTATKLVLNTISTGAMVRLGKVYQNLMVDLQAASEKLIDRGQRIVMAVTGCSREEAHDVIERAGGSVKTALVMQHGGLGRELAELFLSEADGFARGALEMAERAGRPESPFTIYPPEPEVPDFIEDTLDMIRKLPGRISRLAADATDEQLRRRPMPESWSAKEIIEHLIVFDEVMAQRIRAIFAEDSPELANFDESVENPKIRETDAHDARPEDLLRRLSDGRARLIARVQAQPPENFGRSGRHEVYGPVTIYQLLRHLAWHDDHHLQAIRRLVTE